MNLPIISLKSSTALTVTAIATLLNSYLFGNVLFGVLTLIFFFIGASYRIGAFALKSGSQIDRIGAGFSLLLSTIALVGATLYYVGPVSKLVFLILFLVLLMGVLWLKPTPESNQPATRLRFPGWMLVVTAGISLFTWWQTISLHQITFATRSPWLVIAPGAIGLIGVGVYAIATLVSEREQRALHPILIGAVLFSIVGVAAYVYPLGFGFDPFIHKATVEHIAQYGTITPKPFYYIGQYAIELFTHFVFRLPVGTIDNLLVPIIAAVLLPLSAYTSFKRVFSAHQSAGMLALLLLPLASFIFTTPQSLSYVFTLAALLYSLPTLFKEDRETLPLVVILSLAAVITHPLAGIPAAIYGALLFFQTFTTKSKRTILLTVSSLAASVSLPAVFLLQAKVSGLDITLTAKNLFSLPEIGGFLQNTFNPWMDALYLFIGNQGLILLLLSGFGVAILVRHKKYAGLIPLLASGIFFVNYMLLSNALSFSFLIEYERQNYADRLLLLSMLFLLPYVATAIVGAAKTLKQKPALVKTSLLLLFAFAVSANAYGTYPRHDNYARSSGFNVSELDVAAAKRIHEQGEGLDYVVLANQAVSAAALNTYGFYKYYNEDIFYYPIPTGGVLFSHFLDMNESPSLDVVYKAMDEANVDTLFFVVNDYWWDSTRIEEQSKAIADDWFSLGQEDLFVFLFTRNQ